MDRNIVKFSNEKVGVFYNTCSNTFLPMNIEVYNKLINSNYDHFLENIFNDCGKIHEVKNRSFKETKTIDTLRIIVQNDCNLRCKYCYADGGTYFFQRGGFTEEGIRDYLQMFINYGIREIKRIIFFGGEPCCRPEVIEATCNFFSEAMNNSDIESVPDYYIVTNGTIYSEKIASIFKQNHFSITISIDGPKEINDMLRLYPNGAGSFESVSKNYKKMLEDGNVPSLIEATYTVVHKQNGYSKQDLVDFLTNKFSCSKVVVSDCIGEYGIKYNRIDKLNEYYIEIDDMINKILINSKSFNSRLINVLLSLCRTSAYKNNRCYIISGGFTLYPNGDVYPCHLMTSHNFFMGNLKDGICNLDKNNELLKKYDLISKNVNSSCKECWINKICDKCPREDMIKLKLDEEECEVSRKIYEYVLLSLSRLYLDKFNWKLFCKNLKEIICHTNNNENV